MSGCAERAGRGRPRYALAGAVRLCRRGLDVADLRGYRLLVLRQLKGDWLDRLRPEDFGAPGVAGGPPNVESRLARSVADLPDRGVDLVGARQTDETNAAAFDDVRLSGLVGLSGERRVLGDDEAQLRWR